MVKLNNINIDFDCNKETPYFQATSEQRIRFDMEDLKINLIRKIIEDVFTEEDKISVIFVSEYIYNKKRYSSKSKVGKIINIRNWHETVVEDETTGEGEVYATIMNLKREDITNYCSAIYKGHTEAYISFFSDKFLLYVSSDVIDIISNDVEKIANLKQNYSNLFNKFHENGNF
ncbi:hypothetical protein [Gracilibacillus suaedae]|uniref:hypothetical protein n=1 Tax=Gracilibacillus suaedae TaxID=2820273 RepID=UPI001ABEDDF3|nr:hypothetical protein [Gracilibacillus suaedae]